MTSSRPQPLMPSLAVGGLLLALVWSYWTTLEEFHDRWAYSAQYSHGYLVPLFAAVLLWLRREHLVLAEVKPSWWSLPMLGFASAMCLTGAYFFLPAVYQLSLLPMLAGVTLALGGWAALRWAGPSLLFLIFMMPLPGSMEGLLFGPLQRVATVSSTFMLQTFGFPALDEGNTILLNEDKLEVVEACSGLRMLIVFCALTVGMALVIQVVWWLRLVLILSTIPVALIANITRITSTGVLQELGGKQAADKIHDYTGWMMIVLGLVMLVVELVLLERIVVVTHDREVGRHHGILE